MPGTYHALITIGDAEDAATLTLVADRRVVADQAEFDEVDSRIVQMTNTMNEILDNIAAVRTSRAQVESLLGAIVG